MVSSRLYIGVLIAGLFIFSSCGRENEKSGNSENPPPMQLSTSEQIMSQWSGIYRTMSSGEQSGDALGARAVFTSDYQFEIQLENDVDAKVVGNWSEFQGKTLILKISGSTMSSIGAAGKIIEADFELLGNALRLYNKSFDLRLTKKLATNPNSPGSGSVNIFTGSWSCADTNGRRTKISIDDKSRFKLSTVRLPERALVAAGEIREFADSSVILNISSSSEPLVEGAFFKLKSTVTGAELYLAGLGLPETAMGKCNK